MLDRGTEVFIKSKPSLGVFLVDSFSLVMTKASLGEYSLLAKIVPQSDLLIGDCLVSTDSGVFIEASELSISHL